ncbi:MAG: lysoplasmalogenase [Cytophagia bacterium]|nr:lysoplasmalogenase [Cytophagia bacterium]
MTFSKKLLPFILLSLIHLIGLFMENSTIDMVTKPLLMPSLLFYFLTTTQKSPLNIYISIALVFSFLGDTLLMFVEQNDLFFLTGLIGFLIAHLVYIIINMSAKNVYEKGLKPQWQDIFFVLFGLVMFSIIKGGLGEMYFPALVYTVIICLMAITARKRWKKSDSESFWLVMIGASFFVVSDSLLAINKFVGEFTMSGPAIMITYLVAQFLLVEGYKKFIEKL